MSRVAGQAWPQGTRQRRRVDMAIPMDEITFKVRQTLYKSSHANTLFIFCSRLVKDGTLSDERPDPHHTEISRLYHQWWTSSKGQPCRLNQNLLKSASSSSEVVRTDRFVQGLKEAVAFIIPDVSHNAVRSQLSSPANSRISGRY